MPKTIAYCSEALRIDPDNRKCRVLLKVSQKKNCRSTLCLQKAKAIEAKKEEGNTLFKSGDYVKALAAYSDALLLDPMLNSINSKLYSNRATVLAKLGRYEAAIEDSDKALELDPEFFKVYLRRADCYMKLEKFEEAVRDYEKAHQLDKGNRGLFSSPRNV